MPRDKPRAARKNTWARGDSAPAGRYGRHWGWLVVGVAAGATIGVAIMSLLGAPELPQPAGADGKVAAAKETSDGGKLADKPRFEFYTLLRESETIVPDARETEQLPAQPREEGSFLLQAGSFKNGKEAESRRAQLLLLNLKTSVETVNSRPGETWYRVLVGPFESGQKLADARAVLVEQRIEHVVLKRKK
ncbi:MAG: SPOR domain-containing protein [Porticoccaceae bacterium]